MKLWAVEHFSTYLSSLLDVISNSCAKNHHDLLLFFWHKNKKMAITPKHEDKYVEKCSTAQSFIRTEMSTYQIGTLVTKNAWVKEFLHLCSENRISWIFGLFFENAHKWNQQETRTLYKLLPPMIFILIGDGGLYISSFDRTKITNRIEWNESRILLRTIHKSPISFPQCW